MKNKISKPLGQKIWFKILLIILVILPPITKLKYNPADTSKVIATVLSNPIINNFHILQPLAKIILLLAAIIPFLKINISTRLFLGYYAFILVIVGLFQSMAITTDYGFAWVIGNSLIIFTVSAYCFYDFFKHKSIVQPEYINKKRLWVLILMLLAFLTPYSVSSQNIIRPSLNLSVFTNETGLTYCMITPVIIGIMLIFSKGIYKPLLSVISFVGLIFGILNMLTWFVFQSQDWWMGVLHFPLLILSIFGLVVYIIEKTPATIKQQPTI